MNFRIRVRIFLIDFEIRQLQSLVFYPIVGTVVGTFHLSSETAVDAVFIPDAFFSDAVLCIS